MTNTRNRPGLLEFYAYFGLGLDGLPYQLTRFLDDLFMVGWYDHRQIYIEPNDSVDFSDLADALESCRENPTALIGGELTSG